MRFVLVMLMFFSLGKLSAQQDSVAVKEAIAGFDKALTEKNYTVLETLLHRGLTYGHSNAWIQTREDFINDLKSGKVTYRKMERSNVNVTAIRENWATVRSSAVAEGVVDGKEFSVVLHVLHVWVKKEPGGWQLVARQATKMP
ncbi:MAG: nuclear transport factor 2 family protein [Chitinophagaceae bacterium]|nr:nuclear transport factor 2 family protein [Chitinophagaceae bacterium]MCW5927889.1 nuclear transport factor 2 family protein [Chitinophagaceae bacterium]